MSEEPKDTPSAGFPLMPFDRYDARMGYYMKVYADLNNQMVKPATYIMGIDPADLAIPGISVFKMHEGLNDQMDREMYKLMGLPVIDPQHTGRTLTADNFNEMAVEFITMQKEAKEAADEINRLSREYVSPLVDIYVKAYGNDFLFNPRKYLPEAKEPYLDYMEDVSLSRAFNEEIKSRRAALFQKLADKNGKEDE